MGAAIVANKRYAFLGRLGVGGMAEVLLARMRGPEGFERLVVVKRLLPHLAEDADHVSMFLDEARLLSGIRHRNVVSVLELLRDEGEYALVMEYLEGENASAFLKRSVDAGGADPWLAAYVIAEAAAGLHAAHTLRGADGELLHLVHRDVSPQNVFVTYGGEVKLLDFGVARARGRSTRTESGVLKGKLAYMAPEQLMKGPIDRRADVFALGAVLYELTTGARLFRRDNEMATVNAVCHEPIAPPSEVVDAYPPSLEAIVMRALARDLGERYPTADAMRADLRAALKGAPFEEAPSDRLAARMRALFAERIDRKTELIRGTAGHTPEADEQAAVADAHRSPSKSTVLRKAPSSRRWMIAVAIGALALLGGAAAMAWVVSSSEPPEVRIELAIEPPGATVEVDGRTCVSPCALSLPRGDHALAVRASLEGYRGDVIPMVPDVDQSLRVTLVPIPTAEPPAEPVAPTADGPSNAPSETANVPSAEDATPEPAATPERRRGARRRRDESSTSTPEPAFPVFD
ncbi:MAG: serine/threonine-protein kinase [Sandaracinaceae bacterium]